MPDLGNHVIATDEHSVDLVHPDLTIDKSGDTLSKEGDTITYTFVIKNTGDCTLNRDSVTDTVLGTLTSYFPASLVPNEEVTVTRTHTCPAGPDPLINVVTADYVVPDLGNHVIATDDHSVDLVHPSITCNKTANPTHGPVGTVITYTIEVTNTGDVDLVLDSVVDNKLGTLTGSFSSPLVVNATESHDFTRALQAFDPPTLINTVWFHYDVAGLPNDIACSASASVDVERDEGCLEICKFQDSNVNGQWDHGEPWLEGWQFHITGPGGYDVWRTTGPDGCILLEELIPGLYTVTETLKAFWYNTTPLTQKVTVPPGDDCARLEFGNREEFREIPPMVPAVDQWGIAAMIALFAGSLVWTVRRRRLAS